VSNADAKEVAKFRLAGLPIYFTGHVHMEVEHVSPSALEAHRLSAEAAVKVAEAQERTAVATAAVPARQWTVRHAISALVVFVGLALLYVKPGVGGWVVLVVAIMNAPSIVEQIKKAIGK